MLYSNQYYNQTSSQKKKKIITLQFRCKICFEIKVSIWKVADSSVRWFCIILGGIHFGIDMAVMNGEL